MDQNPNTPRPDGFAQYESYMNLLNSGGSSQMPNFQQQYYNPASPPMQFPQPPYNPASPPMQFPQPPYFQPNVYGQIPNFQQGVFGSYASNPNFQAPLTQPSVDIVNETQFQAPEGSRKRKDKRRNKGVEVVEVVQNGPQPWTEDEEVALAKAWTGSSKDGRKGNQKKKGAFWEEVREKFHFFMKKGDYRHVDSISSKWRELNKRCGKFNGIFNNLYNKKESGWTEFDVLIKARAQYRMETNQIFGCERAWQILRKDPKWCLVPTSESHSKKSRGSSSVDVSDGHVNIDLNAGTDDIPDAIAEEFEEFTLPTRPPGRDKERRKEKFGKEQESKSKHREEMENKFQKHLEAQNQKIDLRQKHLQYLQQQQEREAEFQRQQEIINNLKQEKEAELQRQQEIINNLNILKMTLDGLEPDDAQMVLEMKEEARQKIRSLRRG